MFFIDRVSGQSKLTATGHDRPSLPTVAFEPTFDLDLFHVQYIGPRSSVSTVYLDTFRYFGAQRLLSFFNFRALFLFLCIFWFHATDKADFCQVVSAH